MRQDANRLIPRHTHDAKRTQQTTGTSTLHPAVALSATVWNAICSYPVHCASWADMKFVNSYLSIHRTPIRTFIPQMRTLIRIHRSKGIGMRYRNFPISPKKQKAQQIAISATCQARMSRCIVLCTKYFLTYFSYRNLLTTLTAFSKIIRMPSRFNL